MTVFKATVVIFRFAVSLLTKASVQTSKLVKATVAVKGHKTGFGRFVYSAKECFFSIQNRVYSFFTGKLVFLKVFR